MFILASSSAARRKLLKGFRFKVVPPDVREVRGGSLREVVTANARRKAGAVARRLPDAWVLAADTMIQFEGRVYGKPANRRAAIELLRLLAGKTHTVATGVVLQKGKFRIERCATSRVTFRRDPPVGKIVSRTDPTKFAGGYAIRKGDPLIARVKGSVTNVIGLPMDVVAPLLRRWAGARRRRSRHDLGILSP